MTPPARVQAAIELLDLIRASARDNGPAADTIIANWFKTRRYAGSKDRRAVRELVYRAIRSFGEPAYDGRAMMLGLGDQDALFDGVGHGPEPIAENEPRAIPQPVPSWLMSHIAESEYDALLDRAPFDLRVNGLKSSVADVQLLLPEAQAIEGLSSGLRLDDNFSLLARPDLTGLVEVQDAGSQFVAKACAVVAGETVIDLCAGAGGKTLALAAEMRGEGKLIACDTDRGRLSQLGPRAERAGVMNLDTRLLNPKYERIALADVADRADCVLVDAPCSGTGTWRRNPELRWRLTPERLERVTAIQAHVLDVAARLVRPGGRLVYAVCSLLDVEGAEQIAAFLSRNAAFEARDAPIHAGRVQGPGRMLTPKSDGTDGFFVATLARIG